MNIEAITTQMVVLFLIVIAGFIAHKCKLMGGDFDRKLSNFVIQVTCPCLIISSTMGDTMPDRSLIAPLLIVGSLTYVFLIVIASFLPRIMPVKKEDRGMYSFMIAYANVGFIGYPIITAIFGSSAVFYACILNVPNTLTIFIWGVLFVTGTKAGKFNWKLLYSPAMIATYVSIAIVACGWKAPAFISQPFSLLGNMTVPSALLVIGSSIAGIPIRRMMGSIGTYTVCAIRLFAVPVSVLYLAQWAGVNRTVAGINAVLVGMPVASFGTMFCLKYGKDETVMSQGTFWSTLLSVVSIPLLALIL